MKEDRTWKDYAESCAISIVLNGFFAATMMATLSLLVGNGLGDQGSLPLLILVIIFAGLSSGVTRRLRLCLIPKKACIISLILALFLYVRWGSNLARGIVSETILGYRVAIGIIWVVETLLLSEIMTDSSEAVAELKEKRRRFLEEQLEQNDIAKK